MALFIFLSTKNEYETIKLLEKKDKSTVEIMGISKLSPGRYTNYDAEGGPKEIVIKNPGVDYFKLESGSSSFYWDASSKKFKKVALNED